MSFPPIKINPETPKPQKLSQIDSRRLVGVHHRQEIQTKPRKLGGKHVRPTAKVMPSGGPPFRNPKITPNT